jgi:hypothetical protein
MPSMIRLAIVGPTPGSDSNSAWDALFRAHAGDDELRRLTILRGLGSAFEGEAAEEGIAGLIDADQEIGGSGSDGQSDGG